MMFTLNKTFLVLLLFVFLPVISHAGQIDSETAFKIAETLFHSQIQFRSSNLSNMYLAHIESEENTIQSGSAKVLENKSEDALYYVFNIENNNGWIIVSGDDHIYPVIGYSTKNNYNCSDLPPAFEAWMSSTKEIILAAKKKNLPVSESVKRQWESFLNNNTKTLRSSQGVAPYIQTTWGQGVPYNNLCPSVGGSVSISGCVATAMAQIMKYYDYPAKGIGSTMDYITDTYKISIPSVDLSATSYDWNNMLNFYDSNSSQMSNYAVALLMYHCGISAKMDYSPTNSYAYFINGINSLLNYFNYDKGLQRKKRDYISDTEMRNILLQEVYERRPVFIGSQSVNSGGHAFLCCGCDDYGLFYFNWGWNGNLDGYYAMNDMQGYNSGHEIYINIRPNGGGVAVPDMYVGWDQGLSSNVTSISGNESFIVNAAYYNIGLGAFDGTCGLLLLDTQENVIACISEFRGALQPNYGYINMYRQCVVPNNVPTGDYIIKAAVKLTGSNTWTLINAANGYASELPLKYTSKTGIQPIESNNVLVYTDESNIYTVSQSSEKIKEIIIYDLEGNVLYKNLSINATNYAINTKFIYSKIVVVSLATESYTRKVKIRLK